jgi:TQXA domain-containing protein
MRILIGRLTRAVGQRSRPLAVRIAIVALLAGLFGVISHYNAAQAAWEVVDAQPASPDQAAACVAVGTQLPVDAEGGAVTINISGGGSPSERTPVHQVTLFEGGGKINNFCLDLGEPVLDNQPYCQEGVATDVQLAYLIAKYPPTLTDRVAQAARQAAVWHFTNGITLQEPDATADDAVVDAAVLAAYKAILIDVDANASNLPAEYLAGPPALTVLVPDTSAVLPGTPTQSFKVRLTNGGKPVVGVTVNVTSNFGTLDKASGVTGDEGEVAFMLTSNEIGKATVTASATVELKRVFVFVSQEAPEEEQPIGSAAIDPQNANAQGELNWIVPTSLEPNSEPGAGWLLFLPMLKD